MDPKQIAGPNYFQHTSHSDGDMQKFVSGELQDPSNWKKPEVEAAIDALSAEAKLPAQQALDAADKPQIKAGQSLIADESRCGQCHRFHSSVALGTAPDLTGYGSREWLTEFISNPSQKRFYGKDNDRMPAFAPDRNRPEKNRLTAEEIGYLVNWLRGEGAENER